MQVLLAPDIFGKTPEICAIAQKLSPFAAAVEIADPYHGVGCNFSNEDEAYAHFREHVGWALYAQLVRKLADAVTGPLLMVGFSVGATAVWEVAVKIDGPPATKAFCFYGSRIRYRLNLDPTIPVEMFFPNHEPHFDTIRLCRALAAKDNVLCRRVPFSHGFMNPRSLNFDPHGYEEYLQVVISQLKS